MFLFRGYYWRDLKYKIRCYFRPRNSWVYRAVPKEWNDLDSIYEKVLYAGIINYVEGEKCFEVIDWSRYKKHANKIEEIYNWAKTGRDESEKQMMAAYPEENHIWNPKTGQIYSGDSPCKKSYEELYGEVDRWEKYIKEKDDEYLVWLILNRGILWT